MQKTILVSAVLFSLNSFVTHAEDIETITITATRAANVVSQPLASQITIDRTQIELAQVQSVTDLLSRYAGIDVANNGGRGQTASVFIRGASSDQTLVLVDGVRVGSATNGAATWATISPQLIERIEVVKGPRAAVWGSDAIGGVINIITRKATKESLELSVSYGSENTSSVLAGGSLQHAAGATYISFNHEKSDGFDALQTAEPDDDGYENVNVAVNGYQNLSNDLSINWLFKLADTKSDYDTAFGGANQSDNTNQEWKLGADYQWQLGDKQQTLVANIASSRDKSLSYGNGIVKSEGSLFETRRDQFSLINTAEVSSRFTLAAGVDLYREEVISTTDFAETERDVQGYFAHGLYQHNKLSAELAVRYDSVGKVDEETTYNASLGYQITDTFSVSLLQGTGFKAPTFNDLYFPVGAFSAGNPDLLSETSDSQEINVSYQQNAVSASVSWYQTDIENLIEWAPGDDFIWRPTNLANAEIEGVDLNLAYQGFGGRHEINIGYLDAVDVATNAPLARRAKNQFGYQFSAQFDRLDVLVSLQHKAKAYDAGVELDSYEILDLSFQYAISEKLQASLKLHNVLDEEYQTVTSYNTQGRTAFVGLSYQL